MFAYFDIRVACLWVLSCIGAVSILEKAMPDIGFIPEVIVGTIVGWAVLTSYQAALQDLSIGAIDKTLAWLDHKGYISRDVIMNELASVEGESNDD
jgi:uncharacterized membrane protein (Fun14 family)